MKIAITELRSKVEATLKQRFTEEQATRIADYLLWADMSGIKTQGIIKMIGESDAIQNILPKHEITVERDTKLSQLINAGAYPAPLVSQQATDVVIQKAKEHGFGIVSVHNTFSSNGAQAYYVERIAKADLIGIAMARCPGSFAPFGSLEPLFGTNPVGFAFPTDDEPIVFDMATSAMTWYGLVLAKARGEQIPGNMAIDKDGNLTTDPEKVMNGGALLPFDHGYKGSGLGMVVEIMTGPLASSAYCDCETFDKEWGSTFIAIDPNILVDIAKFKANCSDLRARVKTSRTKPGTEIRLPGERALISRKQSLESGVVDVDEAILKQLGYLDSKATVS